MAPRSFSELAAAGAGTTSTGGSDGAIGDDTPYYGTWGADTGASMLDGSANTTGVNGNKAPGALNSFGKAIGSDMSYDDWMKYGGGNFGEAPPKRQSYTDAQLAGDPNMGATNYHAPSGGSSTAQNGNAWAPMPTALGRQDTSGQTPWGRQFTQNTGGNQMAFGGFYAEGGAIAEEDDGQNQMAQGPANGLAAMMQKATASVQEVLAYGRKKHGIGGGGGSDEGAIQGAPESDGDRLNRLDNNEMGRWRRPFGQQAPQGNDQTQVAARMPSVPGTPSNSGVKPVQPMPGPLPPTNNPFGKRAEAEPQDDGAGAIDAPEEEMA